MKKSYTTTMYVGLFERWNGAAMPAMFLCAVLSMFVPQSVNAARLYLDPQNVTYGPGDTFVSQVRLDNADECINAARVEVRYPTESLRAVDFSRGSSIFTLWAEEPKIDTDKGLITFAGGVPGGYCGRIPGDPVISNVLGKIIFTVISGTGEAKIEPSNLSEVYLNDGNGTRAELEVQGALVTLSPTSTGSQNPWLLEVGADDIPPDAFAIEVQSTRGIFGGKYYVVFSTVDKQSGLDHYEIYERGVWTRVSSPHQLKDQSPETIALKAIDKAGNERMGTFDASAIPERQTTLQDQMLVILGLLPLLLAGIFVWHRERRKKQELLEAEVARATPNSHGESANESDAVTQETPSASQRPPQA